MPARPGRALFDQDFAFGRRKAGDLSVPVQFVQPVPHRHRPGAQLGEPAGDRDIDQPCRRQTISLQSFGQRRPQKKFKRFSGQFERVPGILYSRHALRGMFAPDHRGLPNALSRSGRRQRQYRSVARLGHRREFLLAQPVRQVPQKPRRSPRQTREGGEQAAAPCFAERRIQQTARRVGRHPVADKRHHGQRLRFRDPHVHPAVDASGGGQTYFRYRIQQPIEREPSPKSSVRPTIWRTIPAFLRAGNMSSHLSTTR